MAPVAVFLHGAGIFSATELSTQSFSPALSAQPERRDTYNQNHHEGDD
jgi:hypothetical protein